MADDPIRREAEARTAAHDGQASQRKLSKGFELVGLRGEEAVAKLFGVTVDLVRRLGGDGGRDFKVAFAIPVMVELCVDAKSLRRPWNLLVEEGTCKPLTIYVLCSYSDEDDLATPVGWEWGASLLKVRPRDTGAGLINHAIKRERLRPISQLLERVVSKNAS